MDNQEQIYVIYNEHDPFFKNYTHLSPEVKKLKVNQGTYKIEPFYNMSKYRNVRNISDLAHALPDNETLIIEITEEDKEKLNNSRYFTYKENQKEEDSFGKRKYLVNYDFEISNFSHQIRDSFIPVSLERREGYTYTLIPIIHIDSALEERDEDTQRIFGEYSGLYLEVTSKEIIDTYKKDLFELVQVGPNRYTVVNIPEYHPNNKIMEKIN